MSAISRPLAGCRVNISISESDDSEGKGFPSWQVNRVTLQIVSALFGQGASIVFGHDWREDGVMGAVYGFARQVQSPIPVKAGVADEERQPLLTNMLPWPEYPHLPKERLEQFKSTLRVRTAGLPDELLPFEEEARQQPTAPNYHYIRARGLTFLRHQLNKDCDARLCLGGRRSGSAGRYPGVIEEALLALRATKPLFLAACLGGATEQVITAIEGKEMPDDFCRPTAVNALYAAPPLVERDETNRADREINRNAIWTEFADAGSKTLAEANGLTTAENDELLRTPSIDRAIELVLIGLSRIYETLPGAVR